MKHPLAAVAVFLTLLAPRAVANEPAPAPKPAAKPPAAPEVPSAVH